VIAFVTLLLGLVSGPRPVEVASAGEVAEVVILLDGAEVARLRGDERQATVDFGSLAPHLLEAVARDARGHELGRARQVINLPRGMAAAAAEWAVEASSGGLPTVVRLVYETVWPGGVEALEATLDGVWLAVAADGLVELPPYDPGEPHLLAGSVRFASGASANAELAFGGRFGETVQTELTSHGSRSLTSGVDGLRARIAVQSVVWVEGSWLPDAIVAAGPRAPVLAGAEPGLAPECPATY